MSIRAAYEAGRSAAFKKFAWNMPPQVSSFLKSPGLRNVARNALPGAVIGGLTGAMQGAVADPEGKGGLGARAGNMLTHGLAGAGIGGATTAVGGHIADRGMGGHVGSDFLQSLRPHDFFGGGGGPYPPGHPGEFDTFGHGQ